MSKDNVLEPSQLDMKATEVSSLQPQLSCDSNGLRRRRRPKRLIGCHSGHDQWYDAPYQLLSSGYVTPVESDVPASKALQPLPVLLYERELYGRHGFYRQHRRCNSSWMRQILSDLSDGHQDDIRAPQRLYCRQALKFGNFRTSIFDAVLGIEPKGNYVVAIGKSYIEDNYQLQLRLCGIPSCKNPAMSVAPLLMSIPLSEANTTSNIEGSVDYLTQIAPERCPLRVWMSTDERLGACMYRTSYSMQNKSANVVLFPLPKAISAVENEYVFYQLNHVHVPCQSKQDLSPIDDCNLLIRVPCFPNYNDSDVEENEKHWLCNTVTSGSVAYLFLVDVEDGFRLTWIRETAWDVCGMPKRHITPLWENLETETKHNQNPHDSNHNCRTGIIRASEKSRIVVPMSRDDTGWQPMACNSSTGNGRALSIEQSASMALQFIIAFSGFFSVTALLLDILARRPHLVSPRFCGSVTNLPNFTYHLVRVHEGRVAEVLLVFAVGPIGRGCLGVYVEVDMFTQDYREIEWIKHPTHDSPPLTCGKLAFDRRKSQADGSSIQNMIGDTLLDLFYPDCVTMDNRAIRRHVPTMFMSARCASVTISYL